MSGPKPMRATPMKTKKLVRNVRIEAPAPGRKTMPKPPTFGPKPKNQPVAKTSRGKKAS